MRINKILIPVAVILLTVISAVSLVTTNKKGYDEYISILTSARDYASQGIVDDAVKYYERALEINCDVDTYIEYVNVYVENGYPKKALRVAEQMVKEIKNSSKAYECLLDRYIDLQAYEDCFNLDDEVRNKKLRSDEFAQKMSEIEYAYTFGYQQYSSVNAFAGGYAAVKSDDLYGIVDETGNRVLNKAYTDAGCFSYFTNSKNKEDSGFVIPVCTKEGEWQYISPKGNKKIEINSELKFDFLGLYIDNGLIAAASSGKYSYYNTNFEKQFGDYEYASTFNCGFAVVKEGEATWYIINENGEKINSTPYLDVILDSKGIAFRNDRAFVMIDGNYRMIDTTGNIIGDKSFSNAKPFLETKQIDKKKKIDNSGTVLAAVCVGGKWGYIDTECNFVIEPQFHDAQSFSNSFAGVCKDGKWGFINTNGDVVIDYLFDDVDNFNSKGCVFISTNSRWQLLKLYRYNH